MPRKARARKRRIPGVMNGLEEEFYNMLLRNEYEHIRYESLRFKLADKTTYTPDFMVIMSTGEIALYEVKGFWRDDARVKIKVAAEMYPEFRWFAWTKVRGEWKHEEFNP